MKIIYQPVSPFVVNQYFGENKACVSTDGINKFITCDGNNPPQGFKSVYGPQGHLGIDLKAYRGQEVYCAQGGIVYAVDTNPQSGLDIRIESNIAGRKIRHIYEHLLGYQPKVGDKVETGQLVGWADNTGWSSNDHLHFEVLEEINGQWIHIDPMSIMEPSFAKNILAIKNTLKYIAEQVALLSDRLAHFLRK